ncbi:uncharacterized protein METZ01_LOCUS257240, partial [marine metagenome]
PLLKAGGLLNFWDHCGHHIICKGYKHFQGLLHISSTLIGLLSKTTNGSKVYSGKRRRPYSSVATSG